LRAAGSNYKKAVKRIHKAIKNRKRPDIVKTLKKAYSGVSGAYKKLDKYVSSKAVKYAKKRKKKHKKQNIRMNRVR